VAPEAENRKIEAGSPDLFRAVADHVDAVELYAVDTPVKGIF
jgi:hypothetical protein